jgi:hypothetical protein
MRTWFKYFTQGLISWGVQRLYEGFARACHTLPLYALGATNNDAWGLTAHGSNILFHFKEPPGLPMKYSPDYTNRIRQRPQRGMLLKPSHFL